MNGLHIKLKSFWAPEQRSGGCSWAEALIISELEPFIYYDVTVMMIFDLSDKKRPFFIILSNQTFV